MHRIRRGRDGSGDAIAPDLVGRLAPARGLRAGAGDLHLGLGADGAADGGDDESRRDGRGHVVGLLALAGLGHGVGGQPRARLARGGQHGLVDSGELGLRDGGAVQEG